MLNRLRIETFSTLLLQTEKEMDVNRKKLQHIHTQLFHNLPSVRMVGIITRVIMLTEIKLNCLKNVTSKSIEHLNLLAFWGILDQILDHGPSPQVCYTVSFLDSANLYVMSQLQRVLMMVHYTQDHWVLDSVHHLIFQREYNVSETGSVHVLK